MTSFSEHFIW